MPAKIVAIVAGGGLGALCRHLTFIGVHRILPLSFPWGTLLVNILGCFLIGFLWPLCDGWRIDSVTRHLLFTGFLGGFTTFSTFARETTMLFESGAVTNGAIYLLLSNILGIACTAGGFLLAKRLGA